MFDHLGRFVVRAWLPLLAGWVLLLGGLGLVAPRWDDVAESGQFSFLPKDVPSGRAGALFENAFPGEFAASTVVIVLSRDDEKPIYDNRIFIERELKPGLQQIANEEGTMGGVLTSPDPTGSGGTLASRPQQSPISRIQTLADRGSGLLLVDGYKNATLVVIDLTLPFMDKHAWPTIQAIESLISALDKENKVPEGLNIALTGSAVVGRDFRQAELNSANIIERWTVWLVIALLLVIYRAPLLALIPIVTVFFAVQVSIKLLAIMASHDLIGLSETNRIYIAVLAYGAGVDYCLFLTSRYREELQRRSNPGEALAKAMGKVGGTLTASAATVICGIAMLVFAKFGKYHQAGITIPFSLFVVLGSAMTLSPALLRLTGAWAFWPLRPVSDATEQPASSSVARRLGRLLSLGFHARAWERIGQALQKRPGIIWLTSAVMMLPFAVVAVGNYNSWDYGIVNDLARSAPGLAGNRELRQHFPAGFEPLTILVQDESVDFTTSAGSRLIEALTARLEERKTALQIEDIRSVARPLGITATEKEVLSGLERLSNPTLYKEMRERAFDHYVSHAGELKGHVTRIELVSGLDPLSRQGIENFARLEEILQVERPPGLEGSQIGFVGPQANLRDLQVVTTNDLMRIEAAVPIVVFVILVFFLRELVVSIYLILTVLFSYLTTLGMTILVFWLIDPAGFSGLDWKVPIFLFTILIAVGEDYNIFLLTRVKEEREAHGPLPGVTRAVVNTGGIISSCGFIMAGTFASLLAGSLLEMKEMGFALAFGVLLDTLVVRPLLVPAFLILLWGGRFTSPRKRSPVAVEV
jgi:putative drug exporter of the RND superfamily